MMEVRLIDLASRLVHNKEFVKILAEQLAVSEFTNELVKELLIRLDKIESDLIYFRVQAELNKIIEEKIVPHVKAALEQYKPEDLAQIASDVYAKNIAHILTEKMEAKIVKKIVRRLLENETFIKEFAIALAKEALEKASIRNVIREIVAEILKRDLKQLVVQTLEKQWKENLDEFTK